MTYRHQTIDDGPLPTGRNRRSKTRLRRRDAFLNAAETLFLEQGYEDTRLADVVARSGGSLATLYELFGNKQGLLYALAARWRDAAESEPLGGAPGGFSPADMLRRYARERTASMRSARSMNLLRMKFSESLRHREFARRLYREIHRPAIDALSDQFARWNATGKIKIDDPARAARLFFAIISADLILDIVMGEAEDIMSDAETSWRLEGFLEQFGICD